MDELVTEQMTIRARPEHCFEILTDIERYPEWAADIKAVEVAERDDQGRVSRATFRAAAFGRSTSYTLAYDYAKAPRELSWVQVEGDLTRRLDGTYVLEPADEEDTDVTYSLVIGLRLPLPSFIKRRAEGRIMHTALRELRARAEQGHHS